MFGFARYSRRLVTQQQQRVTRRQMSLLEGDVGTMGTRIHHGLNTGLTVLTPLYFLTPDSYTDGRLSKSFGLLLSTAIAAHSYIGLNYVCRDYVPKLSPKLLGPARIATLGLSAITFFGMAMISTSSPGGLKSLVKGLWTGKSTKKETKEF